MTKGIECKDYAFKWLLFFQYNCVINNFYLKLDYSNYFFDCHFIILSSEALFSIMTKVEMAKNVQFFPHLQMYIFCHIHFCHYRRNHFSSFSILVKALHTQISDELTNYVKYLKYSSPVKYLNYALSICTWLLKNQIGKIKFDQLDF